MDILQFVQDLLILVPTVGGTAALIAIIVDGFKRLGLVPDGFGGLVALILNAIAWILVYFYGEVAILEYAEPLTEVMPFVFTLLMSLVGSEAVHSFFKKVNSFLGYSH